MRSRLLAAATSGMAVLGIASMSMSAAVAGSPADPSVTVAASVPAHQSPGSKGRVCYSQNSDPAGINVISTQFSDPGDPNSSFAADDFNLTKRCKLTEVDLPGIFESGTNPPNPTFTLNFYKSKKGLPGKTFASQTEVCTFVKGITKCPIDPYIPLPAEGHGPPFTLGIDPTLMYPESPKQGLADEDAWAWATTSDQAGKAALWENPGDGFGTGCTTWANMEKCTGATGAPDFMFTLIGK
jgi:hypothetical protein